MKLALFGQFFYPDSGKYIKQLVEVLQERGDEIWFEKSYYKLIEKENILQIDNPKIFNELDNSFNFFFSIGGDGTILSAIKFVKQLDIPLVGINTGRLGFLASIHKDEIKETLNKILSGSYAISRRSLIEVETKPAEAIDEDFKFALNEVAISRKDSTSMITVETWLDEDYLNAYWADGIIISTPTGSTGYSLSCGGPVITPDTKSMVITPIAPHNLNARPLVFPDDKKLRFKVSGREEFFLISMDSRTYSLPANTEIRLKKAGFSIPLVQLHESSFLSTLRKKLLWGEDRRN
ncbi:NAD kinase [Psychroflexus planctonicus]|uniref:NAD kinase n=1 Tax=Psychroflexus planctonicus TaxID=1526575 RepID=A0ABQ1SJ23_9FLAO|nr:NAD kinase [Psychroflexus planctonicus]GGE38747.1 NAD kinase [Psychroflexus planctonicus]